MAYYQALPWHHGESEIHKLTRVPQSDNPTHPMLSQNAAHRIAASPTIALGTTDDDGNVWCTVWGGDLPIAQQVAAGGIIGIKAHVDATFDPVVQTIYGGKDDGEILKCQGQTGRMVSGLSIQLEDRDRVKLFGRMVAGCLDAAEAVKDPDIDEGETEVQPKGEGQETAETTTDEEHSKTGTAQLVLHITQSLGNCPKYINKKTIKSHSSSQPKLISTSPHLTPDAITHIHTADIFFIASRGPEDMDCNHRGGSPGFLRVQPQPTDLSSSAPSTLVWPEYSGNNLYQTLGNITHTPQIGLCVPNFVTGDVLYLSGTAEILLDRAAAAVISKTKLAVKFTVSQARFVRQGLMFRGVPTTSNRDTSSSNPTMNREITDGMSPYNPRIRYLTAEVAAVETAAKRVGDKLPPDEYRVAATGEAAGLTATLTRKTKVTPTITRYTFRLDSSDPKAFGTTPLWTPGQYVALDFSEDLYMGYSHMRDDEPTSLNDDFIRTFTVASRYDSTSASSGKTPEFEIVVRNVGVVTAWLSRQSERGGTTLPVLGFGGDIRFHEEVVDATSDGDGDGGNGDGAGKLKSNPNTAFIAAGIGITPLLGQLSPSDVKGTPIHVLWTLQLRDIGLLLDILPRLPTHLHPYTRIFVTGTQKDSDSNIENLKQLEEVEERYCGDGSGITIHRRRLAKQDVVDLEQREGQGQGRGDIERWIVCTAPGLRGEVQGWLGGRSVLFENFDY